MRRALFWRWPATSCSPRMVLVWMIHLTHMNWALHTDECGILCVHRMTHMNWALHTDECGILFIWMSRVTHLNESWHTFRWDMSHTYILHKVFVHDSPCEKHAWHEVFVHVTWLIHVRDVTPPYMWHDSSRCKICVTRNICTCDMTQFICRWDPLAGLELHSVQVRVIATVPCITTLNTQGSRVESHKKCKN